MPAGRAPKVKAAQAEDAVAEQIRRARENHADNLNLNNRELAEVPSEIFELTWLKSLNLSSNSLTHIPPDIACLANLRGLNLHWNRGLRLCDEIGRLSNLRKLDIVECSREIPVSVGECRELIGLYFASSSLRVLPDWLSNLSKSQSLYLWDNELEELPDWWSCFPELRILDLGGLFRNPRLLLPDAWRRSAAQRGEADSPRLGRRRQDVWDFGGQEIMHATHQFFLTTRSLYLVVLNGRAGSADTDADYWLRIVASFAPDSPVTVVLNQITRDPFDLARRR